MTRYNGGKLSGYNPTKICFDCGQRQCAEAENKKLLAQNTLLVEALKGLKTAMFKSIFPGASMNSDEDRIASIPARDLRSAFQNAESALAAVSGSLP